MKRGVRFYGFGGFPPFFDFHFHRGPWCGPWPFPRRKDYLRMLEEYKAQLEEELREVEKEIEEVKKDTE
jgi:hypothetical protein